MRAAVLVGECSYFDGAEPVVDGRLLIRDQRKSDPRGENAMWTRLIAHGLNWLPSASR